MVKECPKKGDLKCTAHPNSTSHADLACYYYRKANGLPVSARHGPDRSKDSSQTRSSGTLPPGNSSQNLLMAEVDNEVDSTEVFTTKDEEQGANMRVWIARNTTPTNVQITEKIPLNIHLLHHLGQGMGMGHSGLSSIMT